MPWAIASAIMRVLLDIVSENGDAVFLIICRPFQVQLNDLCRVVAPYHAMGSGNHIDRQVEAEDLKIFGVTRRLNGVRMLA